jgi:hypothetical protein
MPSKGDVSEAARLMSLARKPAQRKGRAPVIRKCPWCSQLFSARDLRKHGHACLVATQSLPKKTDHSGVSRKM